MVELNSNLFKLAPAVTWLRIKTQHNLVKVKNQHQKTYGIFLSV